MIRGNLISELTLLRLATICPQPRRTLRLRWIPPKNAQGFLSASAKYWPTRRRRKNDRILIEAKKTKDHDGISRHPVLDLPTSRRPQRRPRRIQIYSAAASEVAALRLRFHAHREA